MPIESKKTRNRKTTWHTTTHPYPAKDSWVRLDTGKDNGSGTRRKIWVRDMGDDTDPPNIIFTTTGEHTMNVPTIHDPNRPWRKVPLRPGQEMAHAIAKVELYFGLSPGYLFNFQGRLDPDDRI